MNGTQTCFASVFVIRQYLPDSSDSLKQNETMDGSVVDAQEQFNIR